MTKRLKPEEMRRRYYYDVMSGKIYHKFREDKPDWWNKRFAGKMTLDSLSTFGYRQGLIDRNSCSAHRAAWCIHYGEWPSAEVDHIDGDRENNRIENLRMASRRENLQNRRKFKTNKSGYKGVSYVGTTGRWVAYIYHNRVRIHLGYHNCVTAAAVAYIKASVKYHGNFRRAM